MNISKIRRYMIVGALALSSSVSIANECIDNDGDGWGWDGQQSCLINSPFVTQPSACIDSDGDGWGWDGVKSCVIEAGEVAAPLGGDCIDSDGDGWGWDGVASCLVAETPVPEPETVPEPEPEPDTTITLDERCSVEDRGIPGAILKFATYCPGERRDCDVVGGIVYCANYLNPTSSSAGPMVDFSEPVVSEPDPVVSEPAVNDPAPVVNEPVVEPPSGNGIVVFNPIKGTGNSSPGSNWMDSYSVGDRCFIDSTFDHDAGNLLADTGTGHGVLRVIQIDQLLKSSPGYRPRQSGDPIYNDVQCGNGPPNNAGDEDWNGGCPGRVDLGRSGCTIVGPTWKF